MPASGSAAPADEADDADEAGVCWPAPQRAQKTSAGATWFPHWVQNGMLIFHTLCEVGMFRQV
jgi:hypothetical protein